MNWGRGFLRLLYVVINGTFFGFELIYGFDCIVSGFECQKLSQPYILISVFVIWIAFTFIWWMSYWSIPWVIRGFKKDEVPKTETAPSVDEDLVSKAKQIRKDITDKSLA